MRRPLIPTLMLSAAALAACGEQPTTSQLRSDVLVLASSAAGHFHAHATGAEEVPARQTRAQGQIQLRLSDDGSTLSYKLNVANISNVVASHLHLGPAGSNGPVVAFLYGPAAAGGGRTQGVLAEGEITADELLGPLVGGELEDLVAAIEAGNVYVNVHTNDGVAPTNTGPGDFPGGEVRGQL